MDLQPNIIKTDSYDISLQHLFQTPLFEIQLDDIDNEELSKSIYKLKENDEGENKSNYGGWHSKTKSSQTGLDEFEDFFQHIPYKVLPNLPFNPEIKDILQISAWSNINTKGNYNILHNHIGNHLDLSGVYYVKVPQSGDAGCISFRDPRPAVYGNNFVFSRFYNQNAFRDRYPMEGLLYLFPTFLEHCVMPNMTEEDRISISFNLTLN